jgi:hypothetical protein
VRIVAVAVVALVALGRVASAHQTDVKYVDIAIAGTTASVAVRVAPTDVTEPMGLPADARPSVADAAAAPAVAPYVAGWIAIASGGAPCAISAPSARVDPDGKLVVVAWTATCARAPDTADFTRFFALDRKHVAIASYGADRPAIVRAADPLLALDEPPTLLDWIRLGIRHILDWDGRDHVAFVLSLLLVVMLERRGPDRGRDKVAPALSIASGAGEAGRAWHVRPFGSAIRSTAKVVTAFTIAHSISLIAAALGWIHLPSRFVECAIALSIAYTAAEDIVRPDTRWRFALAFGFGLVHGLGFASTLAEHLPPTNVVVPLLLFNLGVEIGQLAIVAVALPLLYAGARSLHADRYRRLEMPAIAAVIVAFGTLLLVERAFEVRLLGS